MSDPGDDEALERAKAAAARFTAAMERIHTDPGVGPGELEKITPRLLALSIGGGAWAVRKAAEREGEAARLAAVTAYSRETWLRVLALIDRRHQDPDALLPVIAEGARKTGADPWEIAVQLLGTLEGGDFGMLGRSEIGRN